MWAVFSAAAGLVVVENSLVYIGKMLDIPSKLKKGKAEKERKSVDSDAKAIVKCVALVQFLINVFFFSFIISQRYFINIHMTYKSLVTKQYPGHAYYVRKQNFTFKNLPFKAVARLYNTIMWKENVQKLLKECLKVKFYFCISFSN